MRVARATFMAVGGDGTAYEIVNGLFPEAVTEGRCGPRWDFFLSAPAIRFCAISPSAGAEHSAEAIPARTRRMAKPATCCDSRHTDGVIHYINLLSMGFTADVELR